ncbi:class II fumarate hydratase [Exiguobacterium sp. Helios]|uniref:class II fumarate hydratase n=1 Tax=Exiguobacterium sp. Helios TaxID=2735868 RepID=UPI00165E8309|nr:class II fumarate hydratase [Exiguobacterium sp. Helios]QNR21339.1 class II fumarate hydratase [Exiguobacterium sp. Helios]
MEYRLEHDTMGEIRVPEAQEWGAQTQRSLENFKIGTEKMPIEIIRAFAVLKKGAALANRDLGVLDQEKAEVIAEVCDEIIAGQFDAEFPLVVWQTGSGTQSNMNVNEVVARVATRKLAERGSKQVIHPNDDVNKSQSSNDTYPTAMHIAAKTIVIDQLLPAIDAIYATLDEKAKAFSDIVKIGRTHLQDATPITLGQEVSGWVRMLQLSKKMIELTLEPLTELAIGGTAVGTGINAHPEFGDRAAEKMSQETGKSFVSAENKFHALTSHDQLVFSHGAIKALAMDAMKIANDVRWLASGPRAGIGEITIPENEPGSSIMPGKVNPTQSEALTMVAAQVLGNDATIGFAASQGNFELNVFKPVIMYNYIQSVRLLTDALQSFNDHCAIGIEPERTVIAENVERSLMLVTALNPHIGYENAARIAKAAHKEGTTLKEAALATGLLTEEQYDQWIVPAEMVHPNLKA